VRALVTGGSGFIGGRLLSRLLDDGHEVTALIRGEPAGRLDPRAKAARIDAPASLANIVAYAAPDVVFHVASAVVIEHSPEAIADIVQANVTFPTQLLDAMARNGVNRFVNTGTSWQHHDGGVLYLASNLYAASKQAFEDIAAFYNDAHGIGVANLKLFDVYGPSDPRSKIIPLLLRVLRHGDPLSMSLGEQVLDMVHVDDVVEAYLAAATWLKDNPGEQATFAVRSGESYRLKDIVAVFEEVAGVALPIQWGGRPYRDREVMTPWVNDTPVPGWQAHVSLREGLAGVLEAHRLGMLADQVSTAQHPVHP
jgi:nucleoside-diphosphate-sugar epimerase